MSLQGKRNKGLKTQKRSENCEIVSLAVTFNIKDPHQLQLFEIASNMVNFSGYAKRWLDSLRSQSTVSATNIPLISNLQNTEQVADLIGEGEEFDSADTFF